MMTFFPWKLRWYFCLLITFTIFFFNISLNTTSLCAYTETRLEVILVWLDFKCMIILLVCFGLI